MELRISNDKRAEQGHEPSEDKILEYMRENKENYYNARERLRELAYGGKPPGGYSCWGDYWKSL